MSSSLGLHTELDAGSGFCFGVVYAIELAEELLAERGYLYCLGDIVHNDAEVQRLQRQGLRLIDYEQLAVLRDTRPAKKSTRVPSSCRGSGSSARLGLGRGRRWVSAGPPARRSGCWSK